MHQDGSARQNVSAGAMVGQVVKGRTNFLIGLKACFTGGDSSSIESIEKNWEGTM